MEFKKLVAKKVITANALQRVIENEKQIETQRQAKNTAGNQQNNKRCKFDDDVWK